MIHRSKKRNRYLAVFAYDPPEDHHATYQREGNSTCTVSTIPSYARLTVETSLLLSHVYTESGNMGDERRTQRFIFISFMHCHHFSTCHQLITRFHRRLIYTTVHDVVKTQKRREHKSHFQGPDCVLRTVHLVRAMRLFLKSQAVEQLGRVTNENKKQR